MITCRVNLTSETVLPRDKSASWRSKPWIIGPATVNPPKRSRDL